MQIDQNRTDQRPDERERKEGRKDFRAKDIAIRMPRDDEKAAPERRLRPLILFVCALKNCHVPYLSFFKRAPISFSGSERESLTSHPAAEYLPPGFRSPSPSRRYLPANLVCK